MAHSKVFRRYAYGLISIAAPLFCACTEVPEYCGERGGIFDTKKQFCYEGTAYLKCNGNTYDPISLKCENGQIVSKTPTMYAVTVTSAGTGFSGGSSHAAGDTVTIKAGTPPTSLQFKNWTTVSAGVTLANANSATTTFRMPANAVAVMANFVTKTAATHAVLVSSAGTGASGTGSYAAGDTVTIKAGTPPADKRFKNWTTSSKGVVFADTTGETTKFTMPANGVIVTANFETPPLIDSRDNQEYKTVKIGRQIWMAENLNYETKYGLGNSWCYSNANSNCEKYGRLYDWATAMGLDESYDYVKWNGSGVKRQGVCPRGWHLPLPQEWRDLVVAVSDWEGPESAGTKLKATSGFGFSALLGGMGSGSFSGVGSSGYWWTAEDSNSINAYRRYITSSSYVYGDAGAKSSGYSVRCVQDDGGSDTRPTTYAVTVSSVGTGYSGGGSYVAGEMVTITAGTAPTNHQFKNWTTASNGVAFNNASRETTMFTMPANAVTVTAVFELLKDVTPKTVVMPDGKTWMAENLNIETANSWCYNNSADSCAKYGRLYAWEAAKSACQSIGWRLPDSADWSRLVETVGGDSYYYATAGTKLKATSGWDDYCDNDECRNGNGTDDYGFSALPAGMRNTGGSFDKTGDRCYWWTATELDGKKAHSNGISSYNHQVYGYISDKSSGHSVRCIQDE